MDLKEVLKLQVMLLYIIDDIVKQIPVLYQSIKSEIAGYFTNRVKETFEMGPRPLTEVSVSLNARDFLNTVEMTRIFSTHYYSDATQNPFLFREASGIHR